MSNGYLLNDIVLKTVLKNWYTKTNIQCLIKYMVSHGNLSIQCGSSAHSCSNIPHKKILIPSRTGTPSLTPKHTPVHARHKLSVLTHPSQLHTHRRSGSRAHCIQITHPSVRSVTPRAAGHVIASRKEDVGQMRRPGQLPDGIFVSDHRGHGALLRCTDVECADSTVDARRRQDRRTVFVPVMSQRFGWGTCCGRNSRWSWYGRCGRGMDRNL